MLSKPGFGPQAEPESTLGTPDALGESMAAKCGSQGHIYGVPRQNTTAI
jgi:hypothetical protein